VVEDHLGQGMVFKAALELAGFRAVLAQNGPKAMAELFNGLPDLILLDLHLPGMRGDDLLKQIEQDYGLDGTRVIVATGDPALGETLEGKVTLVLKKPLGFSHLQQVAHQILAVAPH
ncbi:MAG: response regulator, partial [Chloroflexota bacterium]